ncbi:MAG TPA: hypothetical protein VGQ53_23745 [Chitinophagaceae bacterium]|jgi:hypothetical protein|nr:hypothetical protein [Chitinophagaceae bacterium]
MNPGKILLYGSILLLIACGPSTKIEKTWTDPSFTPSSVQSFKKILVMGLLKDESTRRIAEDKMVATFKNVTAVQSYSYLQPTDTIRSEVEDKLKKDGFDGVVIMRLADVDKSVSYVPGTGYGGWYGYRYSSPGYYQEDKTFYVETNFYSLPETKLLWSGTTSSLNPNKLDRTVDDVINTLKAQLQKQKLIK